jgi:hypothetical protein
MILVTLVVVGLDNVTVINHKGNILVCDKSKSQDIKKALDLLK